MLIGLLFVGSGAMYVGVKAYQKFIGNTHSSSNTKKKITHSKV